MTERDTEVMMKVLRENIGKVEDFAAGRLYPGHLRLIIPVTEPGYCEGGIGCLEITRSGAEKIANGEKPTYGQWEIT